MTFGIGFVFLTVGRSELFTENFLIPVAAVLVVMLTTPGVLERAALEEPGGWPIPWPGATCRRPRSVPRWAGW